MARETGRSSTVGLHDPSPSAAWPERTCRGTDETVRGRTTRFVVDDLPEERLEDLALPDAQAVAVVLEQLHEDALDDVVGVVVAEAGVAAGGPADEAGVAADEVVDGGGVVGDHDLKRRAIGVDTRTWGPYTVTVGYRRSQRPLANVEHEQNCCIDPT